MGRFHWVRSIIAACIVIASAHGSAADTPITAVFSTAGTLSLQQGKQTVFTAQLGAHDGGWGGLSATGTGKDFKPGVPRPFALKAKGQPVITGTANVEAKDGGLRADYAWKVEQDIALNSLNVSIDAGAQAWIGGTWTADDKDGTFPAEFNEKSISLFSGNTKSLRIAPPNGPAWAIAFDAPTYVLVQDNRKWSQSFTLRITPAHNGNQYKKGETMAIGAQLTTTVPLTLELDGPVTIVAGPDWVPLKPSLNIEAGTALDFSKMGLQDAPAGKHGRVIARPDGQFAFEKDPQTARRFYGINLCFGAHFLTHEQSDELAERLARLGYNALRFHHYEGELAKGQPNTITFNAEKLEQFDYLMAALTKRGIYLTTDLFVSRPVSFKEMNFTSVDKLPGYPFKILVPVHEGAFENWKAFTKALLTHVNPHTQKSYGEDPAMAFLSLINEGNFGNYYNDVKKVPEWKTAWNAHLAKIYADRAALAAAWGDNLKADEDATKGTVALPNSIYDNNPRVRDLIAFFSLTERNMAERMTKFIREELKCQALITNMNAWTNHLSDQVTRTTFDYVDDHFYIDHPQFLERDWSLPSKCPNTSPIAGGASGGRSQVFTRLFDKPFTITEYNYSGPGRFRGVGGILTGSLGSLQGWAGIWRFAYAHSSKAMFEPSPMNYFDMANDPLGQAAERASICLYLRGDMKMAPNSVGVVTTAKEAFPEKKIPQLAPNWHWLGWVTKLGFSVAPENGTIPPLTVAFPTGDASRAAAAKVNAAILETPYKIDEPKLLETLREKGILAAGNPTDPKKSVFKSETGEITIDAPKDMMILDTPRTAGGYAPAGQTLASADGVVSIEIQGADATAWVSSLDAAPIATSGRMLVTHLTDLQNTEIKYNERARQVLVAWGKLPHLVRAGKALVKIKRADAGALKVWALAMSGKRTGEVPVTAKDGVLEFTADVSGAVDQDGARMVYEIAKE